MREGVDGLTGDRTRGTWWASKPILPPLSSYSRSTRKAMCGRLRVGKQLNSHSVLGVLVRLA